MMQHRRWPRRCDRRRQREEHDDALSMSKGLYYEQRHRDGAMAKLASPTGHKLGHGCGLLLGAPQVKRRRGDKCVRSRPPAHSNWESYGYEVAHPTPESRFCSLVPAAAQGSRRLAALPLLLPTPSADALTQTCRLCRNPQATLAALQLPQPSGLRSETPAGG